MFEPERSAAECRELMHAIKNAMDATGDAAGLFVAQQRDREGPSLTFRRLTCAILPELVSAAARRLRL
jgi:hypothetical protein